MTAKPKSASGPGRVGCKRESSEFMTSFGTTGLQSGRRGLQRVARILLYDGVCVMRQAARMHAVCDENVRDTQLTIGSEERAPTTVPLTRGLLPGHNAPVQHVKVKRYEKGRLKVYKYQKTIIMEEIKGKGRGGMKTKDKSRITF